MRGAKNHLPQAGSADGLKVVTTCYVDCSHPLLRTRSTLGGQRASLSRQGTACKTVARHRNFQTAVLARKCKARSTPRRIRALTNAKRGESTAMHITTQKPSTEGAYMNNLPHIQQWSQPSYRLCTRLSATFTRHVTDSSCDAHHDIRIRCTATVQPAATMKHLVVLSPCIATHHRLFGSASTLQTQAAGKGPPGMMPLSAD